MSCEDRPAYHAVRLRLIPAAALVALICVAAADIWLLRDTWLGLSQQAPGYTGLLLVLRVATAAIMGPALVFLLLAVIRSTWFYLWGYRYSDSALEAFDFVLRRRWSMQLGDVATIRTFIVFGETGPGPSRVGHTLVDKGGTQIRLSEALPLWQEIKARCGEATFEERPMPWWEVRR